MDPYLRQFDVEKHEMASVMGIYTGLVGPTSGNVEKVLVFKAFLKGSKRKPQQKAKRIWAPPRPPPPPRRLFWGFRRFGGLMVQGLYTPRGQRPRRIVVSIVIIVIIVASIVIFVANRDSGPRYLN